MNIQLLPAGNKFLMTPVLIPQHFSAEDCDKIVKYCRTLEIKKSTTEGVSNLGAHVLFNDQSQWIYERIGGLIDEVNSNYYRFNLTNLDNVGYFEYHENDFMDWHIDLSKKDNSFFTRKLTMVIFLSSPEEYSGGSLVFKTRQESRLEQLQGSVVLYPSFLMHRIEKITGGSRKIIIASAHGHPFS